MVHISSTAVYGIPDHHPLYEDDYLQGVGPYGEAKIQAEMLCLEYRAKGMCIPILRPKSFVGPERLGVFALLYDFARTGHNFPVIGNGRNRYQLLDVEDLCDVILRVAEGDAAGGRQRRVHLRGTPVSIVPPVVLETGLPRVGQRGA